jgi:hypothetical protein
VGHVARFFNDHGAGGGDQQQYDQMIKYATAIRRTASTEAILWRFTRNASHPTYAAMLEVGRAQKTIFVARYLRLRDLQREIEEGLNVMESSNGANSVIAYGKGGEIASNRREEQEMFVLCLRILQSALVYVNTLMLQNILGEPEWAELLTPADRRGLTRLFWSHVRPYGEVNLDMDTRLDLAEEEGSQMVHPPPVSVRSLCLHCLVRRLPWNATSGRSAHAYGPSRAIPAAVQPDSW